MEHMEPHHREYDYPGGEQLAEAFRLLDDHDRVIAAESARLDREDELDRAAYRVEAAARAALDESTRRMDIQNVIHAANLARDGYEPSWDWRARAQQLGVDEYGNLLTGRRGPDAGSDLSPAPARSHTAGR